MITFNFRVLTQEVYKQGSKQIAYDLRGRVTNVLNKMERDAREMFENDPVTKEIEGGVEASNLSGRLSGYGNLFTFIGFYAEDKPIDVLRRLLFEEVDYEEDRYLSVRKSAVNGKFITYKISVRGYGLPDIYENEELFFPDGWSDGTWVEAMERGVSGFEHYLNSTGILDGRSRSGEGIQVKNTMRQGSMKASPYLSKIFKLYESRLRNLL